MTISEGISRRTWLAGAAATAMAGALPGAAQAARRRKAGDKINIAVIGAGGMGAANASRLTGENIVAACDVDFDHVAKSLLGRDGNTNPERVALRAAYDKAERFSDYRKLFDQRKDIEAVLIATPDHHHAVAAKMAMERGLHVYVQKPLTYTVAESRMLAELARKNPKLVTQMGNQGHSGDDGRRVVELLRGGAIGNVREVHAWTNRPIWPQGIARPDPVAKPASLDWDLWLGPASVDWGYNPDYAHFNWRGWTPFGTGALGDMGAHLLDFPVWALEPGLPTRVETRHSRWASRDQPAQPGSWPLAGLTFFEFGNAKGGPIKLTWYDGGLMPPSPRDLPAEAVMSPEGGVLYIGDQGMLMHETYGEKPVVFGAGAAERAAAVPRSLPRIEGGLQGHERNWLAAIRGETQASCPFAYATTLNETMLLGMVALRAGRPITYDGNAARITDAADANTLLTRDYRAGWTV